MKTTKDGYLSKKDLATRWRVTVRSVERIIAKFNLMPADFYGRQPEFHPADVAGLEERRLQHRLAVIAKMGGKAAILSVKEAKAIARKRGAK